MLPVPWQEFAEAVLWRVGDAGEHFGEPGLWIDVVELGGPDQGVDDGGALGSAIRAGEEPGFPAEGETAQGPFSSVVRQANPAVFEEAGEGTPALQHVVDRLGDRSMTREFGALGAHPFFEFSD